MKILVIPSWYTSQDADVRVGGIFHYEQAIELGKYCEIAIFFPFDKMLRQEFSQGKEAGVLTFRCKFVPSDRIRNRIRMFKAFASIVKQFKPDLVHAHVATEAGRYAAIWCSYYKIPFIVTEHATVEISGVAHGLAYAYGKYTYGKSKRNVCVSEDLQKKLHMIYPRYQFETIYNGIKIPEGISEHVSYKIEDKINIGIVALLYDKEIKGLQFLFQALQLLCKEGYSIQLHIIGGGEYLDYFQTLSKEDGIASNVIFHGTCEKQKVYEILADMDMCVSSSIVESFGCGIAEALLLGNPVVATKCGGPEGFVNSKVGELVDKGDVTALKEGIKSVITKLDRYDRNEISRYARSIFDNTIICQKYMRIYQDVLDHE